MSEVIEITVPEDLIVPDHCNLVGIDGNAFVIMGYVSKELRRAGNSKKVIDSYTKQAMASDYNHLLRVSMTFEEGL